MIENLRKLVLAPPANCERFHVLFLDADRGLLGTAALGQGSLNALTVSLRDLFQRALSVKTRGMIMAHNHPSGCFLPSAYDIDATQRIAAIAQPLEIELVDHLIFAERGVYSMRKGAEL